MYYIFELLKSYDYIFDRKAKILTIRKPIDVKRFIYIKKLLEPYRNIVEEIRVETLGSLRNNYERRF